MSFSNVGALTRARGCGGAPLRFDQACLELVTNKDVLFYTQYAGCEGCKLQLREHINSTHEFRLSTLWPLQWSLRDSDGADLCNGTHTSPLGEYGRYRLNTSASCDVKMLEEPDAAYLPVLETAVTLLALATLWYLVKGVGKRVVAGRLYARYFAREDNELGSEARVLTSDGASGPVPRSPTRSRLRSLDVFRGAAVAMMIFVNAGGGGYDVFSHSAWNGLTVADAIFPCFAWVMGASLVLSLNARLRTAMSRGAALGQVARRSLALALAGIVLGSRDAGWDDVRLPGVLQRLAAMYLVVGALECAFLKASHDITPGRSWFRDIAAGWKQWLVTILLVSVQVVVSLSVAAPGCPRGYLGPGGLHQSAHHQTLTNCTGGIVGYVDRLVLGESHLYKGGSFRKLYQTRAAFDPEGLLGCLSGLLVVQAGAHAARIMLVYHHARARILRWLFWSIVFGATGGALCLFTENGGPVPINKNLWSLSYCLVTAAVAFLIQAVLYFAVDLKAKWGGRPLYYAGQNAFFIYVGSELLKRHFPLRWPISSPTHAQLLATHAGTVLLWLAVAVALHRKRIFISL